MLEQIGLRSLGGGQTNGGNVLKLLQVALANEISVSGPGRGPRAANFQAGFAML